GYAALVDRKQADAAQLGRIGKSNKSLAIAQPAEFAHSEFSAARCPLLVHYIQLSAPGRVAAGVLLVDAFHDFSGVFRQTCAGERQQAEAGEWQQAEAGERQQAEAGEWQQAEAGERQQAEAGERQQAEDG